MKNLKKMTTGEAIKKHMAISIRVRKTKRFIEASDWEKAMIEIELNNRYQKDIISIITKGNKK